MNDINIGDDVVDADGKVWHVLNPPCEIEGAEGPGLFREYNLDGTLGSRQVYGISLPNPITLLGQ